MKRFYLFLVLAFLVVGGGLFAHDKGDLMLNIEPQIGLVIPNIGFKVGGIKPEDIVDTSPLQIGFEWAIRGTVHYYFVDFFGVNAGMGLGGHVLIYGLTDTDDDFTYTWTNTLTGTYFTIPFGFRFSFSALALGAGLTANFPLSSSATFYYKETGESGKTTDDNKFEFDPYMGWYTDIGFDLSGRKDHQGGFGMMFRLAGSLGSKIGDSGKNNRIGIEYDRLRVFSMSVVFQAAIELSNLPIGGK